MQGAQNEDQTKASIIQKQNCPRCDSSNTKFCYYNNYSLSQPRYFCKSCRRYWTHGGTLRNVPVGGGSRKSKRPKTIMPSSSDTTTTTLSSTPPPSLASGGPDLDHLPTSSFLPSLDHVGAYSFGGLPWTTTPITNTIIHSSSSGNNNQNSSFEFENHSCNLLPNHLPPFPHPP